MSTTEQHQPAKNSAIDEYSYSRFTDKYPVYKEINSYLVKLADLSLKKRLVDLGCGVGDSTVEIIKQLKSFSNVMIYAFDISGGVLKEAATRLARFRSDVDIRFVEVDAVEMVQHLPDQVDAVVYCNSIHYVPDKVKLVSDIRARLAPDGVFAFNSSFIQETHTGDNAKFYTLLMLNAIRTLRKEYGLRPSKTVVESRNRLNTEQYRSVVKAGGMKVVNCELVQRTLRAQDFIEFCRFRDFIEGSLPSIPLDIGSKVLADAAAKAFKVMGWDRLERSFLYVVARPA